MMPTTRPPGKRADGGGYSDGDRETLRAMKAYIDSAKAAGAKAIIIHPAAPDEVWEFFGIEKPKAFTRSRGRRLLEWAARWLGYYVR